jgi:3-hydroxybutyryl-CoA dehydratase
MTKGKFIDEIKIGDSAQISNTITETVINDFAKATGDFNPIHLDQTYAEKTYFKGRIAHGVLSLGYISSVLGNFLPGPGGIYLSQEVKFLAPVRIGDTITAKAEVIELIPEKNRIKLKTTCTNQKGEVVVDGTAWSLCPQKG